MSESPPVPDERTVKRIAIGAAIANLVAFTLVGQFVFLDLAYGLLMGLVTGVGTYLFLPWIMLASNESEVDVGDGGVTSRSSMEGVDVGTATIGFALEGGGIMMVVGRFIEDDPLIGAGVGAIGAIALYAVGTVLFRRME